MRLSTGLRSFLVSSGSLKGALDGCVIRLYSGTIPTSADDSKPAGADLLCTVSVDNTGGGITFEAGTGGTLLKSPAEVWTGDVAANGEATWFRIVTPADADDSSTTAVRLQGSVASAGADMQITDPNLVTGEPQRIDYMSIAVPAT